MSHLRVPGARLYYETHGTGPCMVMIPGAGGTAGVFGMVAEQLATHFTVVLYDRRGFSRSDLDGPQDQGCRLATDADDVRRLIEHVGVGPATVFGSSSGAIVALTALTNHPAAVSTAVAHEPPAVRLLPDGQQWLILWRRVYDLYRASGAEPATTLFRARTFPQSDVQIMTHAPRNPANAAYWFEHELRQYPAVELDLDTLQVRADRIVLVAGRNSVGYPCREVAAALAGTLGRTLVDLPGGHIGFVSAPAEFAHELLATLGRTDAGRRSAATTAALEERSGPQQVTGRPARAGGHHPTPSPSSMSPGEWNDSYAATPHWDLGRPQPAMQALADAGVIRGRVLDVGCGTGEHVLMCAALRLDATGVDIAPAAVRNAEHKARERGLAARFILGDARRLDEFRRTYDTVLDCGLFHVFDDDDRSTYLQSVHSVLVPGGRYLMLCFSDQEPGDRGPRRVTRDEIVAAFADGWRIDLLERTALDSPTGPTVIRAWQLTAIRL